MLRWKTLVCLTFGLCLYGSISWGQAYIRGVATYNKINPLVGASITIDGTYDGATSLKDGSFQIETQELGKQKLVCHLIGFADVTIPIEITKGASLNVEVIFTMKASRIEEVVVRNPAFTSSDKSRVTTLKPLDILTTASDGNITSALKTLPGAQQIGESGDLFVRGGTGSETKTVIDGLVVNNFNYSSPSGVASRSRFPPGLFKGSFFSSGGYSALYGQALSSTLILDSEDIPIKSSADLTITPFWLGAGVNKVNRNGKNSWGGSVNYTNLAPIFSLMKPAMQFDKVPEYLDATFFARQKIGTSGMLKFYGSIGSNSVGVTQNDADYEGVKDEISIKSKNVYTNLTYKQHLKNGWKMYAGFSWSGNYDNNAIRAYRTDSSITVFDSVGKFNSSYLQAKWVLTKQIFNRSKLHFGTEFQNNDEKIISVKKQIEKAQTDNLTALFVETDTYLSDNLTARIGLRYEYSSLMDKANIAPRASLGYTFMNASVLTASYGEFYQKPDNNLLWQKQNLEFTNASHYILTYQKSDSYHSFRTELFYKDYKRLVKTVPDFNNNGRGYAQGIELFWRDKKTFKGFDYWLTYSYLDTQREFLNYAKLAQPTFAANHTASAVVKKFFSGLATNIGLTYTYASGRPYYNPNRPKEEFLSDKTIDFHNLGLSVAYLPKIKKTFSVLVLTVSNILGNQQVYGYSYSKSDSSQRTAITPVNNPFVFLGLFINFGIDRSNEIINGRL
ncbi:carboxypeptidase-like regulatory domain-containing protein [Arcicella sp. LKC2W]|uniref:TonB-dependent receptor n=1 Tax=Arcicella sp. LKC2W TaxID=2984198 RepID=UPI002B21A8C6|nr:carboxypeptidase-like regulatory domain-containing protein [Arcicella sp. LKC2W]MEA5460860.1 carboxypeptidase-like regulatory domain-containing protein [Arcicella sp. LKC2W]